MTTSLSEIGQLCKTCYENDQLIFLNNTKFSFDRKHGELAYKVYCEDGAWGGVVDPDMLTLFVHFTKKTIPIKRASLTRSID